MAVTTLSGCTVLVPKTEAGSLVAVPSAWTSGNDNSTGSPTSLAQWWMRFNDPMLRTLVEDALKANTRVTGAQAALLQARASRDVAAAGLSPALSSSASAQQSTSGTSSVDNFKVGLDAAWEADVFGAKRSAASASDATARASAASLGEVQVSVAAEVALNYIALRGAQARLAIANDNLASQLETLQLTQWRQQAGLVTAVEAEQARASVEQTRAQLPTLQTSVAQYRFALSVLTGRPPNALADLLVAAAVPQAAGDLALDIPAATLRQRPDVRSAELLLEAAGARVTQADAERLPSIKLSGSLGLNALALNALTSGGAVFSSLMASVSLPLFDGGANSAQVRVQQAALAQARTVYQAAVLAALKDVENALVALRGDRERLARLQLASETAGNAHLLARQRYASGLVDFQTVLETQRTQLSAQDAVAITTADVSADHVRLYKALGGGWSPRPADDALHSTDDTTRKPNL